MTAVVSDIAETEALGPATVLFVDEEEGVLAGLRATLRRNPLFRTKGARSLEEALAIVEGESIDILVTEIRLPGHDGIELLEAVRAKSPTTVRYVLTGEIGEDAVIRAATVAHRWLSKPCSRDQLLDALDDAVRHQKIIADRSLRHAITDTTALPTPPRLYSELLELVARPDSSIDEIAELVTQDASVSAKLLQWANSAFAASSPVVDLKAAVMRIGLSALSQLVLLAEVAVAFDSDDSIPGFDPSLFRSHTGRISNYAAAMVDEKASRLAGTGGLFANIGLLLEASHLPERLAEAYAAAERDGTSLLEAESRLFGVTHPEIGAHLLSLWGLPSDLVLLVAGSHKAPTAGEPVSAVDAVRIARLLAQRADSERLGQPHIDRCGPEVETVVTRWAERLDVDVNPGPGAPPTNQQIDRPVSETGRPTEPNGAPAHG
jgi:HD-like signal output (HDOD) protein